MTLDELKVQVESRQDIDYLRAEASRFLHNRDADLTGDDSDAFLNAVFKVVCDNVQVNGVDFDKVPAEEGTLFQFCVVIKEVETGKVDEGLVKELEMLQQQTEGVLEQVVRYRRAFPDKAADKLSTELSAILGMGSNENIQNDCEMGSQEESSMDISDQILTRLSGNVEKTIKLREQVPKTVAKLERARTVLAEEGQKRVSMQGNQPQSNNTPWELAVGGAVGEGDLNDVLTRHRRTSHQFDLAHKLSTAASQFH